MTDGYLWWYYAFGLMSLVLFCGQMRTSWLRRHQINEVPTDLSKRHALELRVQPYGLDDCSGWTWNVWFTFDGHKSVRHYTYGSDRKPSPYEVGGWCRDQEKADQRARAAADNARERYARVQVKQARKDTLGHTERLPL